MHDGRNGSQLRSYSREPPRRTFVYRHRDLLEQVHVAQADTPAPAGAGPAASSSSLQADLLNAQQRAARP